MKTIFTNGCFDILHIGHVRLLKFARAQGDRLVVGINSDKSVRRLKGESRPFFNEQERKEMLEALSCVDKVMIFEEDSAIQLIKLIRPDLIVKGGDYKKEDVLGAEYAEVLIFPFQKGYSSSKVLRPERANEK